MSATFIATGQRAIACWAFKTELKSCGHSVRRPCVVCTACVRHVECRPISRSESPTTVSLINAEVRCAGPGAASTSCANGNEISACLEVQPAATQKQQWTRLHSARRNDRSSSLQMQPCTLRGAPCHRRVCSTRVPSSARPSGHRDRYASAHALTLATAARQHICQ